MARRGRGAGAKAAEGNRAAIDFAVANQAKYDAQRKRAERAKARSVSPVSSMKTCSGMAFQVPISSACEPRASSQPRDDVDLDFRTPRGRLEKARSVCDGSFMEPKGGELLRRLERIRSAVDGECGRRFSSPRNTRHEVKPSITLHPDLAEKWRRLREKDRSGCPSVVADVPCRRAFEHAATASELEQRLDAQRQKLVGVC